MMKRLTILLNALVLCSCALIGDEAVPEFDAVRAFGFLEAQCDFGPRAPGTEGHRKCLVYLTEQLKKTGALVNFQHFSHTLPKHTEPVRMTNIIASFGADKSERILLSAHWDTRPWADQESGENSQKPIIGANDGASGVAVLLEIAQQLALRSPDVGVDIVLFDGEDSGISGDDASFALGAQHFARTRDSGYFPKYGILLDMVGDKDLQIYQEENSLSYAPDVVKKVWKRAEQLNLGAFKNSPKYQVTDDHLPLLRSGISCIDIIDFDYEYWHTLEDTPDKCSPESLQQVGQLLLSLIYDP